MKTQQELADETVKQETSGVLNSEIARLGGELLKHRCPPCYEGEHAHCWKGGCECCPEVAV